MLMVLSVILLVPAIEMPPSMATVLLIRSDRVPLVNVMPGAAIAFLFLMSPETLVVTQRPETLPEPA